MTALARIAAASPGTLAVAVRPIAVPPVAVPPLGEPPLAPGDLAAPARPPGGLSLNEDVELPLASVGKLLLLAEVAMSVDGGILDLEEPVVLHEDDYCGGSGLLPSLAARTWTAGDLALLTAAVSDNTATNALLRRIGLDRVNAAAAALGLTRTRLLDRIREPRGPGHPPTFALGTAGELAGLAALVAGEEGWQVLMRGWMLANTDHGLVPALLGHDPEGGRVANKTGTDDGTRADVGLMGSLAYAVLACGPPGSDTGLVRAVRRAGVLIATQAGALTHTRP
ncbi:serine hydrolase [Nonomuraea sp. NPDC049714]|uniref:serine hydrolase n=1 Tax=Nonomuraea sp. NPDC049714 TaxID=3364357 RepID=UPI003797CEC5